MDRKRIDEIEAGEPEATRHLKVALVYNDPPAAKAAIKLFTSMFRELDAEMDFDCELWRLDVLDLTEAHRAAVVAGQRADLIVIALRGEVDLCGPVKAWLDQSLQDRIPGSAALVALLESPVGTRAIRRRTRRLLQSAADEKGLDFFVHEVDLTPPVLMSRIPQPGVNRMPHLPRTAPGPDQAVAE